MSRQSEREEGLYNRQRRLARELKRLYEPIANEPVPRDMLLLLERLDGELSVLISVSETLRTIH